jgi:glycosyltransferase involved in cell wall biosynthesis
MVIPSIWYENNPLSVIESLCMGTPVIGACIGGTPELIENNKTGLLYTHDNPQELQQAIITAFEKIKFDNEYIAQKSRIAFSEENYLAKLSSLFQ